MKVEKKKLSMWDYHYLVQEKLESWISIRTILVIDIVLAFVVPAVNDISIYFMHT